MAGLYPDRNLPRRPSNNRTCTSAKRSIRAKTCLAPLFGQRRNRLSLFIIFANRLAGDTWPATLGRDSRSCSGPHLRTLLGRRAKGRSDLVHYSQHVSRTLALARPLRARTCIANGRGTALLPDSWPNVHAPMPVGWADYPITALDGDRLSLPRRSDLVDAALRNLTYAPPGLASECRRLAPSPDFARMDRPYRAPPAVLSLSAGPSLPLSTLTLGRFTSGTVRCARPLCGDL